MSVPEMAILVRQIWNCGLLQTMWKKVRLYFISILVIGRVPRTKKWMDHPNFWKSGPRGTGEHFWKMDRGVCRKFWKHGPMKWKIWITADHLLFLGSLSDYLRVHELSTRELFNIISTMAKGLAFLHSDKNIYDPHRINKPAIAHRDFKSKNVLLKQDSNGLLSAVISDFGLGTVQKLTNLFMIHTLC